MSLKTTIALYFWSQFRKLVIDDKINLYLPNYLLMIKLALTYLFILLSLNSIAAAEDEISPQTHKDINDTFNVQTRLKTMGLSSTEITAIEFESAYYGHDYNEQGLEFEGPRVLIETQVTERIKTQVRIAFDRLIKIEENKIVKPMDWNGFFRDAKIIIDISHDNTKNIAIPFVTIIGKQTLTTGTYNSEMPLRDDGDLNGLTRIRGAYAIQFRMGPELIKSLDSVILTAFTTGEGSREYQGQDIQKNKSGSMVIVSKKMTENLLLTGTLVHINYDLNPENRFNWGLVYTNQAKDLKVFFNQSILNNNPVYKNSNTVWTFGLVKKVSPKGKITAETTRVDQVKNQYSLGYLHKLNKTTVAGVEVRRDHCLNSNVCANGTYWGGYLEYQWDKED